MDRGVRRRLMVLTFNRVIPDAERVEHIGLLIGRDEPDLLLDWAVRGARRVIRKRSFTEPTLQSWRWRSGCIPPILSWDGSRATAVEFSKETILPEMDTREAYQYFTTVGDRRRLSDKKLPSINGFVQRVVAAKGITKVRTKARRYFKGLPAPTDTSDEDTPHSGDAQPLSASSPENRVVAGFGPPGCFSLVTHVFSQTRTGR